MGIQLKNNAVGYLATAISASDTGAVLQTGNGASFPALGAGDYFYATLESSGGTMEVVKATARSGDSLTIVRAQEGTTAQSFAAGSRFELRVTAASVDDLVEEVRTELAASSGSSLVGFLQAGINAVATTVQSKLRETVSVKDFGAVGDGVMDDTAAIQAAIDAAQAANKILLADAGIYKITSTLTPSNTQPLYLMGEGRGSFDGVTPVEKGTVFCLYTPNTDLFRTYTDGKVSHVYENFMCINKSGGSAESAFQASSAIFCYYRDITISGFEFGIEGQGTLYTNFDRLFIRNCDYGISLWKIGGTPPFSLNTTFYNNIASIRDCQVIFSTVAYRVAGAGVEITNCDASTFSSIGFQIGGSDFNVTSFAMDNIYAEGGTGTPFSITNAYGNIGSVFFGQAFTTGMAITTSRVTIDMVYAYAALTTAIDNNNSRVWVGHYAGAISNIYTNSGTTGKTYVHQLQTPVESSSAGITINQGQSSTIASAVLGAYLTDLTVFLNDNGTTKIQKYIIRAGEVRSVTMQDTPSAYMTVTSVLNGATGRYDVTFTNTAGFAWGIQIGAYAFTPLNLAK